MFEDKIAKGYVMEITVKYFAACDRRLTFPKMDSRLSANRVLWTCILDNSERTNDILHSRDHF